MDTAAYCGQLSDSSQAVLVADMRSELCVYAGNEYNNKCK